MNILVTGLTLHNNKGGPALALSLVDKLGKVFNKANFYMAVPNFGNNIVFEKKWAKIYGIRDVVGAIGVKQVLPPFSILFKNRQRKNTFLNFLDTIDLIVDLTALSYMDLPHKSLKYNLLNNLAKYLNSHYANKKNIKMIRWTQSYGPFSNPITKFIAKRDLKFQKYVFARGEKSLGFLKDLMPTKTIFSFPDIAITLPLKTEYVHKLGLNEKFITIAPSSVIYSIQKEKHINDIVQLIAYLQKNYKIILIPHNLMSTIKPSLTNCDLQVCKEVNKHLQNKVIVISDDLDVYNLKGIISKAHIHIGARYHSVIAALSTAVPAISFAWHNKYKDIMDMYGMGEFVYENGNLEKVFEMIEKIKKNYVDIRNKLILNQNILNKKIDTNIKLFMEMYNDM